MWYFDYSFDRLVIVSVVIDVVVAKALDDYSAMLEIQEGGNVFVLQAVEVHRI